MLKSKNYFLINFIFIYLLFYLIYHSFYGNLNIQNYLVHKFEYDLFQEKQRLINLQIKNIEMDLFALYNQKEDMLDELSKYNNPDPINDETVIKID